MKRSGNVGLVLMGGAAFAASEWIMDELKRVVPIWKHPVFKEEATGSPQQTIQTSDARA